MITNPEDTDVLYDYRDEEGELLYQVVRKADKQFRQRHVDRSGEMVWNMVEVRRVPYRLPELRQAIASGETVYFVEGEKDADRLHAHGLCATTVSGGAKQSRSAVLQNLPPDFVNHFDGAQRIVVVADNDEPGLCLASTVSELLAETYDDVRIIRRLPDVPAKGDVSDYLDEHSVAEFLELSDSAARVPRPLALFGAQVEDDPIQAESSDDEAEDAQPTTRRAAEASRLIGYAETAGIQLFRDLSGKGYIRLPESSSFRNYPVRATPVSQYLARLAWQNEHKPFKAQSYADAISLLEARAVHDGSLEQVSTRVGRKGEKIYLDLCDEQWNAVEIDGNGWRIISSQDCPVRFIRKSGMEPLPHPVAGGSIANLKAFVNVSDEDFCLVLAWLVGALWPEGPYPLLCFASEQGSGKSTAAKLLRSLIDPSAAPLRVEPSNVRDIAIAANNAWCLAFDNISRISGQLSDALCRLSTGGGFSTRALYTDSDEVIFNSQRPVILTSIEDVANRADLLDRSLMIRLLPIDKRNRVTENSLWARFEQQRPALLGCLLDAVSLALTNIADQGALTELPRMADFAARVVAASPALGFSKNSFIEAYATNQDSSHALALEASPTAALLIQFSSESDAWEGTAAALLAQLNSRIPETQRRSFLLPKTPRALSNELHRIAPNLRAADVHVEFLGKKTGGVRLLRIWSSATADGSATSATSATSTAQSLALAVSRF